MLLPSSLEDLQGLKMGGVLSLRIHYTCCVQDSNLRIEEDDSEPESVEKEALEVGNHALEKAESFVAVAAGRH